MPIAHDVVNKILELNIIEMVVLADEIVLTCVGPKCNFSVVTKNRIRAELSVLAQLQFAVNRRRLVLNPLSEAGNDIFNGYINLASIVGNTYIFHCGSQVENSLLCVLTNKDVQAVRAQLAELMFAPAEARVQHAVVLAVFAVLIIVFSLLFLIYFVAGILEFYAPRAKVVTTSNVVTSAKVETTTKDITTTEVSTSKETK